MRIGISHIVMFLILLAGFFYVSLNGLPLAYPGNIMASDPFFHNHAVQMIQDTQQWKYYPSYIAMGIDHAVTQSPPLLFMNAATLSNISGAPSWVILYLLVSLSFAFIPILTYLLIKEVSEKPVFALASAIITTLPLGVKTWLYPLYIGLWIQAVNFSFTLFSIYCIIKIIKNPISKHSPYLVGLVISFAVVLTTHPQDVYFIVLPLILIGLIYLKKIGLKETSFKLSIFIYPLIFIITLSPWIFGVWSSGNFFFFNPHPFGINPAYPSFLNHGWLILTFYFLGLIIQLLNFKKYKFWILLQFYYFFYIMIFGHFISSGGFFGRWREISYMFILPTALYFLYATLQLVFQNLKLKRKHLNFVIVLVSVALLLSQIPSYNILKKSLQHGPLTLDKWNAQKWINQNTQKDSKILYATGCFTSSCMLIKRKVALLRFENYISYLRTLQKNNTKKEQEQEIKISWAAGNHWDFPGREISLFNFERWNVSFLQPGGDVKTNLSNFDYVYVEDMSAQIQQANKLLESTFLKTGRKIVYQTSNIRIWRKNESQN